MPPKPMSSANISPTQHSALESDPDTKQQAQIQHIVRTLPPAFAYDPAALRLGLADGFAGRPSRSPYPPNDYKTVAYVCGFNDATAKRRRSPPSFSDGANAQTTGTYRSENPHTLGTPERAAWRSGWDYLERPPAAPTGL